MGNWSINPHELASIDDNGKAIFQEHTEDVEYTITYNDNVTGASTKKFMVYGCGVDCNDKYKFSPITWKVEPRGSEPIAHSYNTEGLTTNIIDNGGFLDRIESYNIFEDDSQWEYRGYFNDTTSSSDRTAVIKYSNSDGSCEFTQNLVMNAVLDCLLGGPNSITVPSNVTIADIGFSSSCGGEFAPIEVVDQGTLENVVITHTSGIDGKITFTFNGSRNTWLKVKQINGTGTLTTKVYRQVPTSDVKIIFRGVSGKISSGGLMVTGSTYTAEFSLAYNTGTLTGTLTADTRDKMTFRGQFYLETYWGGNIVNECGSEHGEIYAVTSASWNVSTNTLDVSVSKCS